MGLGMSRASFLRKCVNYYSKGLNIRSKQCIRQFSSSDIYDPPYLDSLKPKIPIYDTLNVQMKSYDFALLESYQRLVYKIAKMLDICVEDGWATPAKQTKVQRFKPNSTVVDSEYILNTYERNIQISELPSNIAPIFIELIQAGLPKSITLRVHKHEEEFEKIRYVPDLELKELKTQLDTLGGPVKKK